MSRKNCVYEPNKVHYLKRPSSFIVVILRSLMHRACVCCNKPIKSLEESAKHWEEELEKSGRINEAKRVGEKKKGQLFLFKEK